MHRPFLLPAYAPSHDGAGVLADTGRSPPIVGAFSVSAPAPTPAPAPVSVSGSARDESWSSPPSGRGEADPRKKRREVSWGQDLSYSREEGGAAVEGVVCDLLLVKGREGEAIDLHFPCLADRPLTMDGGRGGGESC